MSFCVMRILCPQRLDGRHRAQTVAIVGGLRSRCLRTCARWTAVFCVVAVTAATAILVLEKAGTPIVQAGISLKVEKAVCGRPSFSKRRGGMGVLCGGLLETLLGKNRPRRTGTPSQRHGSHELGICLRCDRLVRVLLYSARDAFCWVLGLVWVTPNRLLILRVHVLVAARRVVVAVTTAVPRIAAAALRPLSSPKLPQARDAVNPSQASPPATTKATQLAQSGMVVSPAVTGKPATARINCRRATTAKIAPARRE